jgi:hypothetical protein
MAIRSHQNWHYGLRPGNHGLGDRPAERIPDYLNDLNAMHEAEKVLELTQYWHYADIHIRDVVMRDNRGRSPAAQTSYACATAAQRAEAFLRTIGKWEIKP